MKKIYKFNPETLSYQEEERTFKDWIIIIFKFTVMIISALSVWYLVGYITLISDNDVTKKKVNNKPAFYEQLNEYIITRDSMQLNLNEIKIIFNSLDRKYNGEYNNYGFINLLEDYYVQRILISNDTATQQVYNILINEKKIEPFSQLPSEQKGILTNLKRAIEEQDYANSNFNLMELNDLLKIQNDQLYRERKQNTWSIPLAISGIVLSVFFGILSVFYRDRQVIIYDMKKEINSKNNEL